MKIQWQILLYIIIANLVVGAVVMLNLAHANDYVQPYTTGVNATEYEEHFNATDIAKGWDPSPFEGLPIVGDIFAGFDFLWQMIGYLTDGLPTLLIWIRDSYITTAGGLDAFEMIANVIRAVEAVLITTFVIEFISGRVFTD